MSVVILFNQSCSASSVVSWWNQRATILSRSGIHYISQNIADIYINSWEDPEEYSAMGEDAYKGTSGEDRAQRNLRRFAEAHVVPASPWKEGEKVESMGGGTLWWESEDGNKIVSTERRKDSQLC